MDIGERSWVECEKCSTWRRQVAGADEWLGDFDCSMNNWDRYNSCGLPEEHVPEVKEPTPDCQAYYVDRLKPALSAWHPAIKISELDSKQDIWAVRFEDDWCQDTVVKQLSNVCNTQPPAPIGWIQGDKGFTRVKQPKKRSSCEWVAGATKKVQKISKTKAIKSKSKAVAKIKVSKPQKRPSSSKAVTVPKPAPPAPSKLAVSSPYYR